MNRILRKANKRISVGGAAGLLLVALLIGQVLGFMRTQLVNANFQLTGPQSTDAYFAAFKIPDFFFFTLAAGALGVAFMPFLSERMQKGDRKGMWELTSSLLNLLVVVMALVGVIIFIFAEPLIHYIVAPKLGPEQLHNATFIMRCIAFNPLLFTISGIFVSLQQTFGRFFFYAIAPLFYNLSIIVSAMIFSTIPSHNNDGGPGHLGLLGLGIGAAVGAVLQLVVVVVGMYGSGYRYRAHIMWRSKDFHQVLRQLPARSIDQGVDSINSIVETNLSTKLGSGQLSFYENAYILHAVPIQLVGTTIATAAFPQLNERMAQGRTDLFRKDFLRILRAMIWIILPVVVVCYFSRGYLARIIYKSSSDQIALIFGFLTVAILFRTLYSLISRWFYAQKDTKTPLLVSLFTIGLNIVLAYHLSKRSAYGVAGLAIAQSIVAAVEVFVLSVIMVGRDHKLFNMEFWSGVIRTVSVTGFSVLGTFIAISFLPLGVNDKGIVTLGTKLGIITLITFSVHLGISLLFGLDEAKPVMRRIKKIMLKPVKIQ